MESGALSEPDFPAFAEKVVPFLHITTRIEGMKYDGLLGEKGFRGFPSLAFMDAEGEVIHTQGDRSVEGFEKSLVALAKLKELEAKVAAGDKAAAWELLIAKWDLGMLEREDVETAKASMKELNDKQKAKLAWMLVELEVNELSAATRVRDAEQRKVALEKAAKRFQEILASKHELGKDTAPTLWSTLMQWADENQNAEMFGKAVAFFEEHYKDEPRAERWLTGLRERLAELEKESVGTP